MPTVLPTVGRRGPRPGVIVGASRHLITSALYGPMYGGVEVEALVTCCLSLSPLSRESRGPDHPSSYL